MRLDALKVFVLVKKAYRQVEQTGTGWQNTILEGISAIASFRESGDYLKGRLNK